MPLAVVLWLAVGFVANALWKDSKPQVKERKCFEQSQSCLIIDGGAK